jgi:predicted transcriptional regulator
MSGRKSSKRQDNDATVAAPRKPLGRRKVCSGTMYKRATQEVEGSVQLSYSFKDGPETVRCLSLMARPRACARQRRGTNELRCLILEACLRAEQSAYKLARVLNVSNVSWVKEHAMALVRGGFLTVRVTRNGSAKASKFYTTPRGQELIEHLKAFC